MSSGPPAGAAVQKEGGCLALRSAPRPAARLAARPQGRRGPACGSFPGPLRQAGRVAPTRLQIRQLRRAVPGHFQGRKQPAHGRLARAQLPDQYAKAAQVRQRQRAGGL